MWLLPYSSWSGIGYLHPGRFWCHCRMVRLKDVYSTTITNEVICVV
jgi:cycloartenol synthase